MSTVLQLTAHEWAALRAHLLQNSVEQVAVVFARVVSDTDSSGSLMLRACESYHCSSTDFSFQSSYHIELTHETQTRLIKTAWDLGCALVELHSHVGPFARPAFSPSDLSGFDEFVPHVRWRLRGKPYVAIVVAADAFDALVWSGTSASPQSLDALNIDSVTLTPTHHTIRALDATVAGKFAQGEADVEQSF